MGVGSVGVEGCEGMRCEGDSAYGAKVGNVCCSGQRLVGRLQIAGFVVSVNPVHAFSNVRYAIDFKISYREFLATLFNGSGCGYPAFCRLNQSYALPHFS